MLWFCQLRYSTCFWGRVAHGQRSGALGKGLTSSPAYAQRAGRQKWSDSSRGLSVLSCQSLWRGRGSDEGLSLAGHLLGGITSRWLSLLHALSYCSQPRDGLLPAFTLHCAQNLAALLFSIFSKTCLPLDACRYVVEVLFPSPDTGTFRLDFSFPDCFISGLLLEESQVWYQGLCSGAKRSSGSSAWKASTAGASCDVDFVPDP